MQSRNILKTPDQTRVNQELARTDTLRQKSPSRDSLFIKAGEAASNGVIYELESLERIRALKGPSKFKRLPLRAQNTKIEETKSGVSLEAILARMRQTKIIMKSSSKGVIVNSDKIIRIGLLNKLMFNPKIETLKLSEILEGAQGGVGTQVLANAVAETTDQDQLSSNLKNSGEGGCGHQQQILDTIYLSSIKSFFILTAPNHRKKFMSLYKLEKKSKKFQKLRVLRSDRIPSQAKLLFKDPQERYLGVLVSGSSFAIYSNLNGANGKDLTPLSGVCGREVFTLHEKECYQHSELLFKVNRGVKVKNFDFGKDGLIGLNLLEEDRFSFCSTLGVVRSYQFSRNYVISEPEVVGKLAKGYQCNHITSLHHKQLKLKDNEKCQLFGSVLKGKYFVVGTILLDRVEKPSLDDTFGEGSLESEENEEDSEGKLGSRLFRVVIFALDHNVRSTKTWSYEFGGEVLWGAWEAIHCDFVYKGTPAIVAVQRVVKTGQNRKSDQIEEDGADGAGGDDLEGGGDADLGSSSCNVFIGMVNGRSITKINMVEDVTAGQGFLASTMFNAHLYVLDSSNRLSRLDISSKKSK